MQPPDLVALFIAPLNPLQLPYMVTGAVAAVIYGEPRLTRDLDVVVDLRPEDVGRLASAFPKDAFTVPPAEAILQEVRRARDGHFNLIHIATALKADFYVAGEDPLHRWALPRHVRREVARIPVWVAPPEYVLLRKLEWYRRSASPKHLDDVRAMLIVSRDLIDQAEVMAWAKRLGLMDVWRLAVPEAPSET